MTWVSSLLLLGRIACYATFADSSFCQFSPFAKFLQTAERRAGGFALPSSFLSSVLLLHFPRYVEVADRDFTANRDSFLNVDERAKDMAFGQSANCSNRFSPCDILLQMCWCRGRYVEEQELSYHHGLRGHTRSETPIPTVD